MAKTEKFLPLSIGIYRLHVVVTWETTGEEIAQYAKKHHCKVSPNFVREFKENSSESVGLCTHFSSTNPDVLIWLSKKPHDQSTFATLIHELYHAVDFISKSRNLQDEMEARAYLFEYLTTECSKALGRKQ